MLDPRVVLRITEYGASHFVSRTLDGPKVTSLQRGDVSRCWRLVALHCEIGFREDKNSIRRVCSKGISIERNGTRNGDCIMNRNSGRRFYRKRKKREWWLSHDVRSDLTF